MVTYFNTHYVNMINISDAKETSGAEPDCEERTTTLATQNPRANEKPKRIHRLWFIFSVKFSPLCHLLSLAENFTPHFQTTLLFLHFQLTTSEHYSFWTMIIILKN